MEEGDGRRRGREREEEEGRRTILHHSIIIGGNRLEITRNHVQLLIDGRDREYTSRETEQRAEAPVDDVLERSAGLVPALMLERRERRRRTDERIERSSGSGERSRVVPSVVPASCELISSILVEPSLVDGRSDGRLDRGVAPFGDGGMPRLAGG